MTTATSSVIRLSENWSICADPKDEGRKQRWFESVFPQAVPAPVPGIIQQVFPTQHGVFWYYHSLKADFNVGKQERVLLRFHAIDYAADVWVNGKPAGGHEGPETPFEFDVTSLLKMNESNLVAVRVLNPGNERIDGMVIGETPHRNKRCFENFAAGWGYNFGGFLLPVEAVVVPALRIADVFARPDRATGQIALTLTLQNDCGRALSSRLRVTVAAASGGQAVCETAENLTIESGSSTREVSLSVRNPQLWDLDTPFLYRVTSEIRSAGADGPPPHEHSVRIGFRDFRIVDGFFHLNGKRIFLRSTHTGNHCPIGQVVPTVDAGFLRRDLLLAKSGGYNMVRFIAGMAYPEQLDLCDEIGLMVYQENYAGWCLEDSPQMKTRFDICVREMILRDRNHPSLTIWGMLNETHDGPVFRHAVDSLKLVRSLDTTRLVLLSSGRWDCDFKIGAASNPGSLVWEAVWGIEGPNAEKQSMAPNFEPAGGYAYNAGDAHIYPKVPITPKIQEFIRTRGAGQKPVFISELGIGSLFNAVEELRPYERFEGGEICFDRNFIKSEADRFTADFNRWGFAEIYPFPEDLLRESYARSAGHRRLTFDLVRSNPQYCGYNLTGMLDHGLTGEGLWTFWRQWKPGVADALADGFAPLRFCLFVDPTNGYAGAPVTVEAVLANEGVLKPGEYPVTFRIFSAAKGTVWEKRVMTRIPESAPLAVPVLRETLDLKLAAGNYVLAACLERAGNAAGDRLSFRVSPPTLEIAAPRRVSLAGSDKKIEEWLRARGVECVPFEPHSRQSLILVGESLSGAGHAKIWAALRTAAEEGATVVYLSAKPFAEKDAAERPWGDTVSTYHFLDWLYHKEIALKRHALFEDLQCGELLDWNFYGPVTTSDVFQSKQTPDQVLAGWFSIGVGGDGYQSGFISAIYKLGKGRALINSLRIRENLDASPVADRLMANVLRFCSKQA